MNAPGPIALRAIQEAEANVGAGEIPRGSNWGPYVEKYLASVNIHEPQPWCLAFANYRAEDAAKDLEKKLPPDWPDTGYCPDFVTWARGRSLTLSPSAARRGDWLFLWYPSLGRFGHIGMISSNNGRVLATVEGNSNDDGSREGYEVARHARVLVELHPRTVAVRLPF